MLARGKRPSLSLVGADPVWISERLKIAQAAQRPAPEGQRPCPRAVGHAWVGDPWQWGLLAEQGPHRRRAASRSHPLRPNWGLVPRGELVLTGCSGAGIRGVEGEGGVQTHGSWVCLERESK